MHSYLIYDQEIKTRAIYNYNTPWSIKGILIAEILKYEKYILESVIKQYN